jgi:hypothetical protein
MVSIVFRRPRQSKWVGNFPVDDCTDIDIPSVSFDNSGQRMNRPSVPIFMKLSTGSSCHLCRTWQSKQDNIDRTNAVIQTITSDSQVRGNTDVVPIIAPLNE